MTIIDPSTDLGKLRLRCGDWQDIVWLPDSVYVQTLADSSGNLAVAAKTCSVYILGMLSFRTHRKLAALESWSNEAFDQYKEFLMLTIKDPAFMTVCPVPYSSNAEFSPILSFQKAWNQGFSNGTEAQQLAFHGDISPNDGTRTGVL